MHARNAIAEASLSAIALLDAISIPITGRIALDSAEAAGLAGRGLSSLSRRLGEVARIARSADTPLPDELLGAVLDALDSEITRWEQRSREDPDARAVLRAFLGLREILWEFGVRGRSASADPPEPDADPLDETGADDVDPDETSRSDAHENRPRRRHDAPDHATRPRVQRIRIDD